MMVDVRGCRRLDLVLNGELVCNRSHQTHYEQWGELWGTFIAEGHPAQELHLRGYRDHSYGKLCIYQRILLFLFMFLHFSLLCMFLMLLLFFS